MSKVTPEETIKLLTPLIDKAMSLTNFQNREDLEQEIFLMVLIYLRKNLSKELPSFFQMLAQEYEEKKREDI